MIYGTNPGIPPGMKAIKKASRNQNTLSPKNSDKPPQTPASILFWRDLRKGGYELDMGCLQSCFSFTYDVGDSRFLKKTD